MRTILEQVDGDFYYDIILSEREIDQMKIGRMIQGTSFIDRKRYHVGITIEGVPIDETFEFLEEE
jgi:hypothetical protein